MNVAGREHVVRARGGGLIVEEEVEFLEDGRFYSDRGHCERIVGHDYIRAFSIEVKRAELSEEGSSSRDERKLHRVDVANSCPTA